MKQKTTRWVCRRIISQDGFSEGDGVQAVIFGDV